MTLYRANLFDLKDGESVEIVQSGKDGNVDIVLNKKGGEESLIMTLDITPNGVLVASLYGEGEEDPVFAVHWKNIKERAPEGEDCRELL